MTNQERRARTRTRMESFRNRGHVPVGSAIGLVLDRKAERQLADISDALSSMSYSLNVLRRATANVNRPWWSRLFGTAGGSDA